MAELKTKETDESVAEFLDRVGDESRKKDCKLVAKLMKEATKAEPKMWGDSIVGFGRYRYKYASGREAEWFLTGFSPRKNDLTLYIYPGLAAFGDLLKRLGKHKTSVSCLHIKKLSDVDINVLKEIINKSVKEMASLRVGK
jgi:Domain of unknown function (DU1801)